MPLTSAYDEDRRWVQVVFTVAAGCWRGSFDGSIERSSFGTFRAELEDFAEGKERKATFAPLGPYLHVLFERTIDNEVEVTGTVFEHPAWRHSLDLSFTIEAAELPLIIAQLRAIEETLGPVEGEG